MAGLVVNERVTIPESELSESFARSSGPGGQNVNKVATKVELRWSPDESAALSEADRALLRVKLASRLTVAGELVVTSDRTRDQVRNREDARAKLVELVSAALQRPKRRKPTRPTRSSRERRLSGKKRRGDVKRGRGPVDDG